MPPLVTPNNDFYRIDTAFSIPRVDVSNWRLQITGLVERPYSISFTELLGLSTYEEFVTLCCVSNQVGRTPDRQCQVAGGAAGPRAESRRGEE